MFKKKMKKQGGFTLIEMLIVVAIIAILVAVSIPLVNSALERTRRATDAANERAAKAEATIAYLTEQIPGGWTGRALTQTVIRPYDAVSGKLLGSETAVPDKTYGKCSTHKNSFIKVTITVDGEVTVAWANNAAAHDAVVDE